MAKKTAVVTGIDHCGLSASASVSGFRKDNNRTGIIKTPKICSNVSSAIRLTITDPITLPATADASRMSAVFRRWYCMKSPKDTFW